MSTTIVDMAKVTQMLDAGWHVRIYKGPMGSYEVRALHPLPVRMQAVRRSLVALIASLEEAQIENMTPEESVDDFHFDNDWLMTDDFTPEQALTRMSYKVFGEIL